MISRSCFTQHFIFKCQLSLYCLLILSQNVECVQCWMYWLMDVVPLQKHNQPTKCHHQWLNSSSKKSDHQQQICISRGKTTRRLITLHRHVSYCSWRCVFAHEIGSQGTWRISIKILVNQWLAVTTKAAHDGNCIPPEQYGLLHTDSKELTNALYMSEVAQKSLNLSTDVTMDWSLAWFWD